MFLVIVSLVDGCADIVRFNCVESDLCLNIPAVTMREISRLTCALSKSQTGETGRRDAVEVAEAEEEV